MSAQPETAAAHPVAASRDGLSLTHIVCGIDGSRASHEAARQAALIVAPGGRLELIAVTDEWGVGLNGSSVLTRAHARRALDAAARDLRGSAARVETRMVNGRPPWDVLLREASGSDLLAVARHSHSRAGGITIGRTAAQLIHRANLPLLVAVPPPHGAFPARILVAADGPGRPEQAVRVAGVVARRTGGEITLVRLSWSRRARRPELAAAISELNELGVDPAEVVMAGLPRRQIPLLAARERASLVVTGSRGLVGTRALGSASERIAHESPCSVLVVRPRAPQAPSR